VAEIPMLVRSQGPFPFVVESIVFACIVITVGRNPKHFFQALKRCCQVKKVLPGSLKFVDFGEMLRSAQ
jgi:hypothetical protein